MAIRYFMAAAEGGNTNAQYHLGYIYDSGSGVEVTLSCPPSFSMVLLLSLLLLFFCSPLPLHVPGEARGREDK
jgi:hypothetical protein